MPLRSSQVGENSKAQGREAVSEDRSAFGGVRFSRLGCFLGRTAQSGSEIMVKRTGGVVRYIGRDMRRVDGWLNPLTAQVVAELGLSQSESGVAGAVGEIGVHHGKLWFVLDHLAMPDEMRFAIDVFDMQELNTDRSGKGDLARFKVNRKRYGAGVGHIEIIQASSLSITPDALFDRVGPTRLFSIDGGHTAECTFNDLRLANSVLCEGGVLALDDVFNELFPGVVTGLAQYLASVDVELVPFCIAPGKVLLTRPSSAERLTNFVRDRFSAEVFASRNFFGREVPILMRHQALARRIKLLVAGTTIEPLARGFFNRFMR